MNLLNIFFSVEYIETNMAYVSCDSDVAQNPDQYIINEYTYNYSLPLDGSNYDLGGKNLLDVGTIEATTMQKVTNLQVEDQQIELNKDEEDAIAEISTWAGLIVNRTGALDNYHIGFWESDDTMKLGASGSEQAICCRNDSGNLTNDKYMTWDSTNVRINSSTYGDTEVGAIKTKTDYITISDTLNVSGASSLNQGLLSTSSPTFNNLSLTTLTCPSITKDSSNITIATTTSGDIALNPTGNLTSSKGAIVLNTKTLTLSDDTSLNQSLLTTSTPSFTKCTLTNTGTDTLKIAYDGTHYSELYTDSAGNLNIVATTGDVHVNASVDDIRMRLKPLGGSLNQISELDFYGTFGSGGDCGTRRITSITSKFIGTWGSQYMIFGVGGNDSQVQPEERLRIGTSSLLSSVPETISYEGTVTSTVDFLEITNTANNASMTATGTGLLFNQWYYDAGTPAVADAGRIAVITEGNWTSDGNTHDSYVSFQTALNGTVDQKMSIGSEGDIEFTRSATNNEGFGFYIDDVAGQRSTWMRFLELTAGTEYGSSIIYAGNANPTINGASFTLPANTLNIVMHNASVTGGVPAITIERDSKQIGVGTTSPTALLDIEKAGTVTATTDILEITNSGNAGGAGSMTDTGTGLLFNQYYYDVTTPAVVDAGRIAVITETDWTSTGTTQDSKMSFQTALNGSVQERWSITSGGILKSPTSYQEKIIIYGDVGSANYGIGFSASRLDYRVSENVKEHVFGYGSQSSMTDMVSISGSGMKVDIINEMTADTGCTIEGILMKDSGITLTNAITEFSTDNTLGDDSDTAVPTEKAVKYYVDNHAGTSNITSVGAVSSGSITTGFGNIDNASNTLNSGASTLASLELGGSGAVCTGILDEDSMATNSAVKLCTQQSIKAYVDDITTLSSLETTGILKSGSISSDFGGIDNGSSTLNSGASTLSSLQLGGAGATCTTILDEDAMGSNSATSLCTQQSIKAYVDNHTGTSNITSVGALSSGSIGTGFGTIEAQSDVTVYSSSGGRLGIRSYQTFGGFGCWYRLANYKLTQTDNTYANFYSSTWGQSTAQTCSGTLTIHSNVGTDKTARTAMYMITVQRKGDGSTGAVATSTLVQENSAGTGESLATSVNIDISGDANASQTITIQIKNDTGSGSTWNCSALLDIDGQTWTCS